MTNTTLTSILLALFALGIVGCSRSGTASNMAAVAEPGANKAAYDNTNLPEMVPPGPGTAITAQELGKEYQRDPAAFDQKYKCKTLAITGNAILAGRSGDHFAIMLAAVENESTSKSVNIECSVANNEQANELGRAVDASLEQVKNAGGNTKGVRYPGATIKGIYEYSPPGESHGQTMPIITLKPCELRSVTNVG